MSDLYLVHGWKEHKYIKKVKTKSGKWRYIYAPTKSTILGKASGVDMLTKSGMKKVAEANKRLDAGEDERKVDLEMQKYAYDHNNRMNYAQRGMIYNPYAYRLLPGQYDPSNAKKKR